MWYLYRFFIYKPKKKKKGFCRSLKQTATWFCLNFSTPAYRNRIASEGKRRIERSGSLRRVPLPLSVVESCIKSANLHEYPSGKLVKSQWVAFAMSCVSINCIILGYFVLTFKHNQIPTSSLPIPFLPSRFTLWLKYSSRECRAVSFSFLETRSETRKMSEFFYLLEGK